MTSKTAFMTSIVVWGAMQAVPVLGQDAILPHGDPRLQQDAGNAAQRSDARDQRLKQQGQGDQYRIDGEPQPSSRPPAVDESPGLTRQDTGIEDPSVNPGQAAGMRSVQGRIIKSDADTHVLRQLSGSDTTLTVDQGTAGDRQLQPGDVITGIVTPQGRAVVVHKEQAAPSE